MKRVVTLSTMLALLTSAPALAQSTSAPGVPGQEFMLQWDLDGDGKVTLDEARTHRADIFGMFDSDGNGSFSDAELAEIDAFKLAQLDAGMGPGHQMPDGMQPGQGRNQAQGMGQKRGQGQAMQGQGMLGQGQSQAMLGQGQGQGQGQGMQGQNLGMSSGVSASARDEMLAFDSNRDGVVTQAEFVAATDRWFAFRERTGDAVLTTEDFGPAARFQEA